MLAEEASVAWTWTSARHGTDVAEVTKAGDFVLALMVYATRCIEDGETEELLQMGFGPAEVEELAGLRLADIKRMSRLESHCLEIKLDRLAFAKVIRYIRADGRSEEWEHRMVQADASRDMMRSLFGTSKREYARLRELYGVSSNGRPRKTTAEEEESVWRLLSRRFGAARNGVLPAEDYIAISEELGIPLRIVWRESNRMTGESD